MLFLVTSVLKHIPREIAQPHAHGQYNAGKSCPGNSPPAMDVKAAARSKRAASQRGRACHSHHKHPQKVQRNHEHKQQKGKHAASSSQEGSDCASQLLSNWSRYEDEEEDQESALPGAPSSKSRGADYRELLSQGSSSFVPDISVGRKLMMTARGADYYAQGFEADCCWKAGESSEEASYFSLDLDFLAKELAKVEISKRLFLDPEFIPSELGIMQELSVSLSSNQHNIQKNASEVQASCEESILSVPLQHGDVQQNAIHDQLMLPLHQDKISNNAANDQPLLGPSNNSETSPTGQDMAGSIRQMSEVKLEGASLESMSYSVPGQRDLVEEQRGEASTVVVNKFVLQAAEEELDSLLDMLNDCNLQVPTTSLPVFSSTSANEISIRRSHEISESALNLTGDNSLEFTRMSNDRLLDFFPNVKGNLTLERPQEVGVPYLQKQSETEIPSEDFDEWLDSL